MEKHRGEMQQQQLPLAFVRGEKLTEKPKDLFIPEQALEVQLAAFEGPLDLLLYLIRKQKFDIADLPIAPISEQYLHYLDLMKESGIELIAEYLLMAATLTEIKSRMLLPKPVIEEDENDPRAELMEKLKEYQQIKQAADLLMAQPQFGRDIFDANVEQAANLVAKQPVPDVALAELVKAYQSIMAQQAAFEHHHVSREAISTQEKMQHILDYLKQSASSVNNADASTVFAALICPDEGKQGVVVTFLAILELIKAGMLRCQLTDDESGFYLALVA